jgi:insulysin
MSQPGPDSVCCYPETSLSFLFTHCSGYNHKAHALLQRIADTIEATSEKATEELFLRIKDKIAKEYYSFLVSPPYQHAMYGVDLCLDQPKWSIEDKLAALESTSFQDVANLTKRVLSRFQLEMLVHGNATPDEAKNLASILLNAIKPKEPFVAHLPDHRVVKLDPGKAFFYRFAGFNESDTNNCLATIYQIGPIDINTTAMLALLHHLMKEPAFHELRTEEQLGYIVQTTIKTNGDDVKSLLFLIQSDAYDPIHLDQRVEAFIERFQSKIDQMSEEELKTNIDAVVETFLEKVSLCFWFLQNLFNSVHLTKFVWNAVQSKNIGEESQRYWNVITNRTYVFMRRQLIAAEAKTLSKEQLLHFFSKHIANGAPSRQKLAVQVFAKSNESRITEPISTGEVLVIDPVEFKRSSALFPLVQAIDLGPMKM